MKVYSVIGLGYGDEGKGVAVDYLASLHDPKDVLVIRHSGGHQVGHTVKIGDIIHEFHHFGSGSLRGIPTLWAPNLTIYPSTFRMEYDILKGKGATPELFVYDGNPITTPFDVAWNRAINRKRGMQDSVGVGFSATLKRQELLPLYTFNLEHDYVLKEKLNNISEYYWKKAADEDIYDIFAEELENLSGTNFIEDCKFFIENSIRVNIGTEFNRNILIFEGNQGILLDKNHGFYPYVTYGTTDNTTLSKWLHGNVPMERWYVTRAYSTRHGAGKLEYEHIDLNLKNTECESNHKNDFQGSFRTAPLNVDLLKYALQSDLIAYPMPFESTNLLITCVDQIEDISNADVIIDNKLEKFDLKLLGGLTTNLFVNTSPESNTIVKI